MPASLVLVYVGLSAGTYACAADSNKLAFVITRWNFAAYESEYWDECPEGVAISQDEYWWRGLSVAECSRLTGNGEIDVNTRIQAADHRGPNGEDVCWQPTLFNDPPLREATGKILQGFNLDGTTDGKATPHTCAHETFETSPDGAQHIDNQPYRVLGCNVGWRNFGVHAVVGAASHRSGTENSWAFKVMATMV